MAKMWAGVTAGVTDSIADDFNSSIRFDCKMYKEDITGSMAHAAMLGAQGIISQADADVLIDGLQGILDDLNSGKLEIDLSCEDIHMFVEQVLTQRLGDVGKKLHTARSRNDQVALDLRMYLRSQIDEITDLVKDVIGAILKQAEENKSVIMPGYTHLQRAQPILFSHHLMAYAMMLLRDLDRLADCRKRMNISPIGCCALAGTTYNTDREFEAKQLGFDGIAMTDCMEMDAIRANMGTGEGAVRAIEAGVDILTISHTYEAAKQAVDAIYAALESGRLTEERIQKSYDRIMKMKEKMGLLERQNIDEEQAAKVIMAADKLMLCREVATDSITLLKGEVKLDLEKPDFLVIAPDSAASTGAEDMRAVSFADRAAARFGCLAAKIPLNGEADAAKAMLESAVKMGFKKVVLGLFNARFREGQVKVLREVEAMPGVQLTVVLLGAPYDYPLIERADGVVCSYEYTALSVEALLDALATGEFAGESPVKFE